MTTPRATRSSSTANRRSVASTARREGRGRGLHQRDAQARAERHDVLILDTAGRLHVDDDLMDELHGIQRAQQLHQILLVVDAMVGQDAVHSAKAFHDRLSMDGVILTKLDSDTRGVLPCRSARSPGHRSCSSAPARRPMPWKPSIPSGCRRILGMGDVVSLVEKAQDEVDEAEAEPLAEKMMKGEFTMNDFIKQLKSIRRMGSMKSILDAAGRGQGDPQHGRRRVASRSTRSDGRFDDGQGTRGRRPDQQVARPRISRGSGTSTPT